MPGISATATRLARSRRTRLLIREDHVLEAMLAHLGARVSRAIEPFTPEGGAYGMGRTMGHEHGHTHSMWGQESKGLRAGGLELPAALRAK